MAIGDPYASLGDLKAYLRIPDDVDDPQLRMALDTATTDIEEYCNRQFNIGTASDRLFEIPGRPYGRIVIDDVSTVVGMTVAYRPWTDQTGPYTTIDTDRWLLGPDGTHEGRYSALWRLRLLDPPPSGQLKINAAWGWSEVPQPVKNATLLWASRIFARRDTPEGILGAVEEAPIRVSERIDPEVRLMLRTYRKHQPGRF